MANAYYSNQSDKRIISDTVRRVRGGKGTQQPRPRRRRHVRNVGGSQITVYELENCDNAARHKYVTNIACADHLEGGDLESTPIAVVQDDDGLIECWRLVEIHQGCSSGDCVQILAWTASCAGCNACFLLNPCDELDDPIIVRGPEWFQYLDRRVWIRDAGETVDACYLVELSESCDDVNEEITTDDIEGDYATCEECLTCYEVTSCADDEDIRYIGNDLAFYFSQPTAADVVDLIFRDADGACWEVTAYVAPCEEVPEFFELPDEPDLLETCDECCYLFTPCAAGTAFVARTDPAGEPLEPLVGKVVSLAGVCYTVSRSDDCTGATVGIPTLEAVYDDCGCCHVSRWQKCGTTDKIRTRANLCAYENSSSILKRAEDEFCYEYYDNAGSETIVAFTVEEVYPTCALCLDPRYKLTPSCTEAGCGGNGECGDNPGGGGGDPIVTQENLRDAVGKYVKVRGQCYIVSFTTDAVTEATLCWDGPFEGCEECNAAPSRLTVITKRGDSYFATTIVGSFTVCDEEDVTGECPAQP
jgi:hypothetical protein